MKRIAEAPGSPEGEVSNWLHADVRQGDVLSVSAPFGDVALDEGESPLLLASAGIGSTPMISMLAHLAATGSTRQVIAVHADRSQRTHAFRDELGLLVDKLPYAGAHLWYERPEVAWPAGRTGLADLSGIDIPGDTRAYLCGPVPFMRSIRSQLLDLGVPADRIHYEVFGPDLGLATAA